MFCSAAHDQQLFFACAFRILELGDLHEVRVAVGEQDFARFHADETTENMRT